MKLHIKSPFPDIEMGKTRRVFRHFGYHLKPHKRALGTGGLALLAMTLVEIARPWPLKIIFDYVLLPNNTTGDWQFMEAIAAWEPFYIIALASGLMIGLSLIGAIFSQIHTLIFAKIGQKVAGAIRLELFTHVQKLPQSYHDYRQTGELMMRLTRDITLLKELLTSILVTLGSRFLIVLGMLAFMFYMNWRLTLIALGVLPLLMLVSLSFSVKMRHASKKQRKKEGQLSASVFEGVDGIVASKLFGQEKRHQSVLKKLISSATNAGLKAKRLQASYERWVDIITAVGMALVLFFGVQQVLAGSLSAGSLLVFISYLRSAYKPLRQISRLSANIAKATVSGERVLEILEMEPGTVDKPDGRSANHILGEITFSDVSLSYKSGQKALSHISLVLPAKQTTAIIGPSGAGKSSIAKLITRLYEPNSGQILIDQIPLEDYRVKSLRKQITVLSQESLLFRQTIRDNIAFGKPDATLDEILAAAKRVGAHDFIEELPKGYDTLIGEGGRTLSGGQSQRIAFARAALRDSRIMIFDEPTTGLDPSAESVAREAISLLKEDKTVLLITHRLSLLDMADWIVYMVDGSVVEQGTLESLLCWEGKFYEFYNEWLAQSQAGMLQGTAAS